MTSEEQIKSKSAWVKLRNIAKHGPAPDEHGARGSQEAATLALATLRPLLAVAYHQGLHDGDEHDANDPDAQQAIEENALQAIIDSLGLGLEA